MVAIVPITTSQRPMPIAAPYSIRNLSFPWYFEKHFMGRSAESNSDCADSNPFSSGCPEETVVKSVCRLRHKGLSYHIAIQNNRTKSFFFRVVFSKKDGSHCRLPFSIIYDSSAKKPDRTASLLASRVRLFALEPYMAYVCQAIASFNA